MLITHKRRGTVCANPMNSFQLSTLRLPPAGHAELVGPHCAAAAAAAVTSGHYTDNKAPRYTHLQGSHVSRWGSQSHKGSPIQLGRSLYKSTSTRSSFDADLSV